MGYANDIKDPLATLTREAFLAAPGISTRLPVASQLDVKELPRTACIIEDPREHYQMLIQPPLHRFEVKDRQNLLLSEVTPITLHWAYLSPFEVRNKAWFGLRDNTFGALIRSWTCIKACILHAHELLQGQPDNDRREAQLGSYPRLNLALSSQRMGFDQKIFIREK